MGYTKMDRKFVLKSSILSAVEVLPLLFLRKKWIKRIVAASVERVQGGEGSGYEDQKNT